jgi:propionyl-CoA carboxylase alpha chain
MIRAIENYRIDGVKTTLPFGKFVCEHEAFRTGNFNTHFVKNYYSAGKLKAEMDEEAEIAAKLALRLYLEEQKLLKIPS